MGYSSWGCKESDTTEHTQVFQFYYMSIQPLFIHSSIDELLDCFQLLKVKVKVAQLCPTLCNPMGYTVHGILRARILEWVAFPFSRDLPNPSTEPRSPTMQADSLPAEPQGKPIVTTVAQFFFLAMFVAS